MGRLINFSTAITTDTNAYATGDNVGGKLTVTADAPPRGIIRRAVITDLAVQGADMDLIIFNENPSGTTFTNNAALDIADADITKIAGRIALTSDVAFADNGITENNAADLEYQLTAGTTLYAALVSRGTPTYAASDLTLKLVIEESA